MRTCSLEEWSVGNEVKKVKSKERALQETEMREDRDRM